MDTRRSGWWRFTDVLYVVVLVVLNIATVQDLVNGSADEWSAWDWLWAALLAALLLGVAGGAARRFRRRRRGGSDRPDVDLARVRATHERDGRVAAVEEVRRQDPTLPLPEATRLADASRDHDPRTP